MKYILVTILVFTSLCSYAQTRIIDIQANDFVYNKSNKKVYAIVSKLDERYSNKLIELDPFTGEVERTVLIGGDPKMIKLTSNNQFVYISFHDTPVIKKIALASFQEENTISIGSDYVRDFEIRPNTDDTIIVIRVESQNNITDIVMFINGVIQPKSIQCNYTNILHPKELCLKGDGTKLYCQSYLSTAEGYIINILDDGLEFESKWTYLTRGKSLKIHDDILYSSDGNIIDPFSDTIPILKAMLPVLTEAWGNDDGIGFSYSPYHNCYVYAEKLGYSFINFFDPHRYNYLGSIFIDCDWWINYFRGLEVIDETNFVFLATDSDNRNHIFLQGTSVSQDASLGELYPPSVWCEMEPSFEPDIYEYTINLFDWYLNTPTPNYIPRHPLATTKLIRGYSVPSSDTLIITAQDGITQQRYIFNYKKQSETKNQKVTFEENKLVKEKSILSKYDKRRWEDKLDLLLLDIDEFHRRALPQKPY